MKNSLLCGVSAAAVVLGLSVVAVAQPNDANNNTNAAITQEASGDAVAGANAVENGALVNRGNAAGEFSEDNALANANSAATHFDADGDIDALATDGSIAVDDGALVKRNGAALGFDADDNAVVGGKGTALNAVDVADEGSSVVTGHGSHAASADDGGASVAGDGVAIGIQDVTIGQQFGNGIGLPPVTINQTQTVEQNAASVIDQDLTATQTNEATQTQDITQTNESTAEATGGAATAEASATGGAGAAGGESGAATATGGAGGEAISGAATATGGAGGEGGDGGDATAISAAVGGEGGDAAAISAGGDGGDGGDASASNETTGGAASVDQQTEQSIEAAQQVEQSNEATQQAESTASNENSQNATVNLFVEGGNSNGFGVQGGDDITAAFGVDNVVASAHLESTVTGLAVAVNLGYGENDGPGSTGVSTGDIVHNSVHSLTGANRVVANTGIANQGRALAVAGDASFNHNNNGRH